MKKLVIGFTFLLALAMSAMAGEWSGYISDAGCAKKQGAKTAADTHAGCAKGCIKRGDKAVLVGDVDGDNITVKEVKS
jgi:hypothetical protein